MPPAFFVTQHARHRSEQRSIPHPVIGLILDYGDSLDAGDGARKFALSKSSMRTLRQDYGIQASKQLDHFRKAYVVATKGRVITAAFAQHPLFH